MFQTSAPTFDTINSYNFMPVTPPCRNRKIHEFNSTVGYPTWYPNFFISDLLPARQAKSPKRQLQLIYGLILIIAAQSPGDGARSMILLFAVSMELVRLPVLGSIHVTLQFCPVGLMFKVVSLTSTKYTR